VRGTVTVGAVQMAMSADRQDNVNRAELHVREAAARGADIILLPELFEGPYFPKDQHPEHFERAHEFDGHPAIERFRKVAAELGVVLPVSVFERAGNAYFNAVAIVDADGSVVGRYRKSHIPDGPGYTEKFYFTPGDTGFRACPTRPAIVGAAICWDQWFPEAARAMALQGAEILLYPTAIGSEPADPDYDSSAHWRRTMLGHAAANLVPVVAANRVGHEVGASSSIDFYGTSFIADQTGEVVAEAGRDEETVITATFDLDDVRRQRAAWGLFRDRRPDLYGPLLTFDGGTADLPPQQT
jgi:N-carbamoylputrescine amidase